MFLVANLLLAIISVSVTLRVAFYLGVLDKSLLSFMKFFIGMPILVLSLLLLGLFGSAVLKLYRQSWRSLTGSGPTRLNSTQ